ncbi:oxidoreductase [Lysinibacter cavernae]|uniref:2,4-dienoyl-CoA reductase-like NADH-dependent reductase (Old Yellow Enzyme family)/NADPH-dependent 2,4-dienoyl-CoA reductase/sulfur reductase-like enzyme n=1 Tax=Lysinibacter cavernae TaxID=1640652 RepID=A0A7X5R2S3_9MICO|nr:FAD-dependent oxidoreductase [Lysinibacter cavernae]NIH54541.1 2,4-dienoyl-CoA reductase-like NADH-dependent reductase (Old Yellow Enzyme family)/NADPH-dependent 2,4-dienoyl-CoA reductase/sulfur reductase-like enzyme [Lysinibacter cavernae]
MSVPASMVSSTASATRITNAPLSLGGVTLRNRLVSAPMERNYCEPNGHMNDVYQEYLLERARAGVALIMTEATYVRADGKGRTHQLGAHDDSCIPGLRRLADALHAEGALVGCELNHGGRTAQTAVSGLPNIAPSPVACEVAGGQVPREMTADEARELAAEYGRAAARCVEAGIDVLSIHAAHGYLIHQFMSPISNHRTDEFGDPVAFLNLVIDEVRAAAPTVTLGMRVSVVEGPDDGLDAETTLAIIERAHLNKLDFLDISAGSYEAGEWIVQSGEWKPGVLADYALRYRKFGLPLGLAGRLNSPEIIEQVLTDGVAEFVSLARALHADPLFATACLADAAEPVRYRPCIACNVCIDNLGDGPVGCTVNPAVGRGRVPVATPTVRPGTSVIVAGAGPAGLTAARELAQAGADVTIVDRGSRIGGNMELAAQMKSTPDFHRFLDWSEEENERLGIRVELGTTLTSEDVAEADPSAVVLATGGEPTPVSIPVAQGAEVMTVQQWLDRVPRVFPSACTVWGSDAVAMQIADYLADRGVEVLVVGADAQIAPESGRRAKILAVPRLEQNPHVRIRLSSTIAAVELGRVLVTGPGGEQDWLDAAGPVLLSQGVQPRVLSHLLPGVTAPVVGAGTLVMTAPATVRNSILSGYDVAQELAATLR